MLIYNAFGWKTPDFAHVSLILAGDKSKLSKRHGATSVGEYRGQGCLPDAMINFLSLLGWNDGTEQEIYSKDELAQKFSLDRIHKSGAVFDKAKLVNPLLCPDPSLEISRVVSKKLANIHREFFTHQGTSWLNCQSFMLAFWTALKQRDVPSSRSVVPLRMCLLNPWLSQEWMNGQYLKHLPTEQIEPLLAEEWIKSGLLKK